MKLKLFIFSILTLLLVLPASTAMACNCGKKVDAGNQSTSCQHQCNAGCEQSACSGTPMLLVQGKTDQGEKMAETKLIEVGNKICPVSGDKVPAPGEKGAMGADPVKYEYNGKIYNLCCPMCIKDFKKNPEKYSKISDDEVVKEKNKRIKNKEEENNMPVIYTCPMHPEVKSDKPGKCPKCGMNLQPEAKKK